MRLIRIAYAPLLLFFMLASCESYDLLIHNDRCKMVPDPGPCKAMITKYYYDKSEKACKKFIWGGCDGVVPFDTMEQCKDCLSYK